MVAGPSLVVRILGDVTGLAKSFGNAANQGKTAASGLRSSFNSVLTTLNSTGVLGPFGDALAGVEASIERIGGKGRALGPKLAGIGAGVAGAGLGFSALGSKDQAAQQQLQQSIEATGKSYDDYETQVEQAIKSQEKFGRTANQTQDALRVLTQATNDPAKAMEYLGTASDLAAAKHEGLTEAAGQLGKAYNGAGKILKEFGLTAGPKAAAAQKGLETATKQAAAADDHARVAKQRLADIEAIDATKKKLSVSETIRLRDAQQKVAATAAASVAAHQKLADAQDLVNKSAHTQGDTMTALAAKLHGQASAAADTFGGHLEAIKAKLEDSAATLGQKYGPALTAVGASMSGVGAAVSATRSVMELFAPATTAAAGATEGLAAAEVTADAAGLPLLATFGLVIAAIAALGLAAYVIYRNWGTIWAAIKAAVVDVWDWIKNNWPYLTVFILGPIGLAVGWIVKHWGEVIGAFKDVYRWLRTVWQDVYGFTVKPLLAAAKAIGEAFRFVFNAIAWVWNHTVGELSFKIPSWVPGIGGHGFSVPNIPTLAQGGLVTNDGLVYAHAGEVIAPIDKVPRGPAMYIETAHFNQPVDVDLITRRLEFALGAGLPI